MGFIRKALGTQDQIDAANKNAAIQIAASKEAADAQVNALNSSAKAAADQQAVLVERQKAEQAAAEAASKPLDVADVALDPVVSTSIAGERRKTRAKFGQGASNTGAYL